MNMRWAWTWPVLSSVATILIASPVWGQGAPPMMPGAGPYPAMAAPGPAYGPPAYGPQGMYPPEAMYAPGGYPPPGMPIPGGPPPGAYAYPGMVQPAAYQGAPPAVAAGPLQQMPTPAGPMPGAFPSAMAPDAYGAYGYMPADPGYGQPVYDPQGMVGGYGGYGGPMPGDGGCPYCGGQGCEHCGRHGILGHGGLLGEGHWLHHGLLGDVLGLVAPYSDGGCAAPRWFDVAVDFVMMRRDDTGRNVPFTSQGITGPIVLQTDDMNFDDYQPGFRFQGNIQLGAANSVEFTYLGQLHYNAAATVRDPNNQLFSVVSQYGLVPFGGFTETDQSDYQQINYSSKVDSFEANWRSRWMSPNCRYQGSWTLGVRYLNLLEKLRYHTSSAVNGQLGPNGFVPAQAQFNTSASNALTGLQLGTDLWLCLVPGLRVGGEVQAGVYGNHVAVFNTIGVNDVAAPNNSFVERVKTNDVAFVGQANLQGTYRINYQWTARAGYQLLFIDGVALATENFNASPPALFFQGSTRTPTTNDNGTIFLHGWTAGFEYMW